MTFSDLTEWDINLIKSKAIGLLVDTKATSRYSVLVEVVLGCISCKGYSLSNQSQSLKNDLTKNITPTFHDREPIKHLPTVEVISQIFQQLQFLNVHITKDESKIITWNQPNDGWHHKVKTYKPPWVM
jgi:hypothetical protein